MLHDTEQVGRQGSPDYWFADTEATIRQRQRETTQPCDLAHHV